VNRGAAHAATHFDDSDGFLCIVTWNDDCFVSMQCLLLPETAGTHSGLGDAKEVAVVRRSPSVELFPFVIETLRLRNDEQLKVGSPALLHELVIWSQ
jgi:hypothetical protein